MSKILSVNTRCYPSEHDSRVEIKVVLVAGAIGDYAAYIGQGTDDYVWRQGDKLAFEEARIHFPTIENERYRR